MHRLISICLITGLVCSCVHGMYPTDNYYKNAYDRTDETKDYYRHPAYSYKYSVHDPHTGDIKTQGEQRDGDVVKGFYTFHEADGTLREVHYEADKVNGFRAHVKRTGQSSHPQYYQKHDSSFNF